MSEAAQQDASTALGFTGSLMSLRGAVTVWIPLILFLSTAGWMAVAGSVPVGFSGTVVVVGFALSGDPVVRLILHIARDLEAQRRNTMALIAAGRSSELTPADAAGPGEPVGPPLRGGLVIGVLERLSVMACLVLGFPNGVAIVVAIKGLARYGEFTTGHQREQFIIGTLASLLWAGAGAGLVFLLSAI